MPVRRVAPGKAVKDLKVFPVRTGHKGNGKNRAASGGRCGGGCKHPLSRRAVNADTAEKRGVVQSRKAQPGGAQYFLSGADTVPPLLILAEFDFSSKWPDPEGYRNTAERGL